MTGLTGFEKNAAKAGQTPVSWVKTEDDEDDDDNDEQDDDDATAAAKKLRVLRVTRIF